MSVAIALEYTAHDGCPDRAAFVESVRAQTALASADDGERVVVSIAGDDGASHGELILDGGVTKRTLDAPTCGEVASGLAFALALVLDERDRASAVMAGDTADAAALEDRPTQPRAAPATPDGWTLGFSGDVFLLGDAGLAPRFSPWIDRAIGPTFSVRAGAAFAFASAAHLSLRFSTVSLEACALVAFRLSGCAGVDVGVVQARGRDVAGALDSTRAWIAPLAAARVVEPLGHALVLEAQAGVELPLVRDTFTLAPATVLFRAPAVAPWASVGLAVTFP